MLLRNFDSLLMKSDGNQMSGKRREEERKKKFEGEGEKEV